MPRRRKKRSRVNIVMLLLIAGIIIATGFLIKMCIDISAPKPSTSAQVSKEEEPEIPAQVTEDLPKVIAAASVGTQGDLLMHRPIINACKQEDGSYDFSPVFRYTKSYTEPLDYAIANLETTLAGSSFPYQGYPAHNCPDELADAAKNAGFDMLLTANNHCADTHMEGINRTLEQARQRGFATLGTRLSKSEKRYSVVDVNGIQIGMVCYTYAMGIDSRGVCMNGSDSYLGNPGQVNYFTDNALEQFYAEMEGIFTAMKQDGAEATMLFIHWGVEYERSENAVQRSIAQKMCDMGFDVIVGGHPHVVQPMDLLTSGNDPEHKTVCIYSLGNAISNQFVDQMTNQKSGHTEDGVLFTVHFEKYADGSVFLRNVELLPTWIIRTDNSGTTEYSMVPLDSADHSQWQSMFRLTDTQLAGAGESYDRTMAIVGPGLAKANDYLNQAKALRDGM